MSRAALQSLTSDIADAFLGAGFADNGTYTAPAGSPINCRVIVDRAVAPFGDFGKVIAGKVQLILLLAEIPVPVRGAVVAVDGQSWRLVEMQEQDASTSKWSVEVAA